MEKICTIETKGWKGRRTNKQKETEKRTKLLRTPTTNKGVKQTEYSDI